MSGHRYDQCDETCTVDCGHCKGKGRPADGVVHVGEVEQLRDAILCFAESGPDAMTGEDYARMANWLCPKQARPAFEVSAGPGALIQAARHYEAMAFMSDRPVMRLGQATRRRVAARAVAMKLAVDELLR